MNKILSFLLTLGMGVGMLASCNDDLSQIGEVIQPKRDVVDSEKYFLQFEAKTVLAPELYSGASASVLLGAYSDPNYGSFVADFASQFRTGVGLSFEPKPEGGRIDSVCLDLIFDMGSGFVGSRTAPIQMSVYELPSNFTGSDVSVPSLSQYAQADRLLAQQVVTLEKDFIVNSTAAEEGRNASPALRIQLDRSLGQRIYDKSLSSPHSFATQQSFVREVFAGLYVTPSTGRGFVIKPLALSLKLYYTIKDKEGKSQATYLDFINTKLTARRNGLGNEDISALLAPNAEYSYSKGPAGVQTAITLSREQMQRLLVGKAQLQLGKEWTLADTQLNLQVDNPEGLLLNPPAYMMLMPKDSLATYFKQGLTERSSSAISYLSTEYKSTSKSYNFYNVSALLTQHLLKHAHYHNGAWQVNKDLELRIVPVERSISGRRQEEQQTASIDEYLFPSFVRLRTDAKAMKIGVTASVFK